MRRSFAFIRRSLHKSQYHISDRSASRRHGSVGVVTGQTPIDSISLIAIVISLRVPVVAVIVVVPILISVATITTTVTASPTFSVRPVVAHMLR